MNLLETQVPAYDLAINECRDLWNAVIECAINDARSCKVTVGGHARAWIFSPAWEVDFGLACHYAGLEPAWVRRQATRYLQTAPTLTLVPDAPPPPTPEAPPDEVFA